jgi:hypothetical protein
MEALWVALDQQGILTPDMDTIIRAQFQALLKARDHG